MSRPLLSELTAWITEAALHHPDSLRQALSERLGVGSAVARALLRELVAAQWLKAEVSPRRVRFSPGLLRQVVRRYPIAGLHEDRPWSRDFLPCLTLPDAVARMAQHAFTELLNNAIEHSGGGSVTVSMRQTPLQLQLLVSDDGRGIFDAIGETYQIDDPAQAMLELAQAIDESAMRHDVDVILTVACTDIRQIAEHTRRVNVFAPHMDPLPVGPGSGAVLAEAL